jgi:hypothetical protein
MASREEGEERREEGGGRREEGVAVGDRRSAFDVSSLIYLSLKRMVIV